MNVVTPRNFRKPLLLGALLLVLPGYVIAQESNATPVDGARYADVIQDTAKNSELVFSDLPPISDRRTHNAVFRYLISARAWWVNLRCKFGDAESNKAFAENLRLFTNTMDSIFANDFHKSLSEGNKYSQMVQMRALENLSANKFYGCSDKARDIASVGSDQAARFAPLLRSIEPPSTQIPK